MVELFRANEALQRQNRCRIQFTSMISHELRTPLSAIKESISIVMDGIDGPLNPAQQETLGIAKNKPSFNPAPGIKIFRGHL